MLSETGLECYVCGKTIDTLEGYVSIVLNREMMGKDGTIIVGHSEYVAALCAGCGERLEPGHIYIDLDSEIPPHRRRWYHPEP